MFSFGRQCAWCFLGPPLGCQNVLYFRGGIMDVTERTCGICIIVRRICFDLRESGMTTEFVTEHFFSCKSLYRLRLAAGPVTNVRDTRTRSRSHPYCANATTIVSCRSVFGGDDYFPLIV